MVLGISRKSILGAILDKPVDERMIGGITAAVSSIMQGASIIRTHDVEETRQAITVLNAIETFNVGRVPGPTNVLQF